MDLGLTKRQRDKRRHCIGGSDATIIMSGDAARIEQLWLEKRGEREPENLDDVLPVVMGQWTEELNRLWYQRRTCRTIWDVGKECTHSQHDILTCTLDGVTTTEKGGEAVFEAKHVSNWDMSAIVDKYQPQMQHQMMVTNLSFAVLSVFIGNLKWECAVVPADLFYQAAMLEHELRFWEAVQSGSLPHLSHVEPPHQVSEYRSVDMTGRNEWAALAADWRDNYRAVKIVEKAAEGLKVLVERDVKHAYGHGIQIKRNAVGHLRISLWEN